MQVTRVSRWSSALLGALVALALAVPQSQAAAPSASRATGAAPFPAAIQLAAASKSKRFDLSDSLVKPALLWKTGLKHPTVMQSFAYDPTNNDLYTVQVRSGEGHLGNLVVTARPGKKNESYMVLEGFGHGAAVGIQRDSSKNRLYLWIESKASKKSKGNSAFGTRIARVAWSSKRHVTPTSSGVVDLTPPQAVGKSPRPMVDQKNNLLVVRTSVGTKTKPAYRFRGYRLDRAAKKDWRPEYDKTISVRKATSQGTTVYGDFIYLYWGNANKKNTVLETYSLATGKRVQVKHTEAYKSLDYREPEGIGIYRPRSSKPVLAFGFASGKAGARKATIAGKDRLIG